MIIKCEDKNVKFDISLQIIAFVVRLNCDVFSQIHPCVSLLISSKKQRFVC